jgi:carboxyl-terminal processing protease
MSMRHRILFVALVLAAGLPAQAAETKKADDSSRLAERMWFFTDFVLTHHYDPATRQEMLRAGLHELFAKAGASVPAGLSRRLSAVTTEEQLAALLRETWPRDSKGPVALNGTREGDVIWALVRVLPEKPALLPPDVVRASLQFSANRYVGTGIQLGLDKDAKLPRIVTPFRNGPAYRAGIRPGDLLVAVDGKSTKGVELQKVVQWLRGNEGEPVVMTMRRPDSTEERPLRVVRGVAPIDSVYGYQRAKEGWRYRIAPDVPVGYVWLSMITSSTLHELRQAEGRLRAEGVRALVIDLRSGQQDDLHQAALVADGLLSGGLLWCLHDNQGRVIERRADAECLFRGWPLALLVDRTTAAGGFRAGMPAALAAALQDNGRAVLVGEPTVGGERVQTILPLPDGTGGMTLWTARLERAAKGKGWPVRPDEKVVLNDKQRAAIYDHWLREKQYTEPPAGAGDKPPDDPQLARAVEVLKAALDKAAQAEKREPSRRG